MEKDLRMLGETIREGFAYGALVTDGVSGNKSIQVEYLNPILLQWMNLSETSSRKLKGYELFESGSMPELYQISEIEMVLENGTPSVFKIFCSEHDQYYEVLIYRTESSKFAMVVKSLASHAAAEPVNRPVPVHEKREAGLQFLIDNMSDVIWRVDSDFRYTYVSASVQAMWGYSGTEMLGKPFWDFMTPEGIEQALKYHQKVLSGFTRSSNGRSRTMEVQIRCKDGSMNWSEIIFDPIFDHLGMWIGYQGVSRDITDRKSSAASLMEFHQLMEAVLENMAQAMVVINARQEVAVYNKKFLEIFGFSLSEVLSGVPFVQAIALWRARWKTSRETVEEDLETMQSGRAYTTEYWQSAENDEKIWIQMFHNPLPGGGFVRTYTDITDRKRYELDLHASHEKLAAIAALDDLTGVLNRRSGFQMLKRMERECLERGRPLSLCFVDVDELKKINDRFGHSEGDELIRSLADVIKRAIRAEDAVCRVGGDEFMILFPGCDRDGAHRLVERIRVQLEVEDKSVGRPYAIRFSYGIEHLTPDNPMPIEELIRRADREMYRYKNGRK